MILVSCTLTPDHRLHSLFELKGGRVAGYREYFDTGAALPQLGFGPESLAKVLANRI